MKHIDQVGGYLFHRRLHSIRCQGRVTDSGLDELFKLRRIAQINKAGRNIYFAWSGGINRDDPHYYRIQTPSFLIELDDAQDEANHVHSVWRDLTGDFGQDLLKQHYETSHR